MWMLPYDKGSAQDSRSGVNESMFRLQGPTLSAEGGCGEKMNGDFLVVIYN